MPPLNKKICTPSGFFCIEGICLIPSWIVQILDHILWMEFQCTPLELCCFLHNLLDFAVFCTAPIEGIAFCPHGDFTMKTPPSPVDFQLPQMGVCGYKMEWPISSPCTSLTYNLLANP